MTDYSTLKVYVSNFLSSIFRLIGIGGLLDFDTTLPLAAIHFILLMIMLKFYLLRPTRQISVRRSSEMLSYVEFGDAQVDKILRVFYKMKIHDWLENAITTRNSVIFASMVKSFNNSLIKKNKRRVLAIFKKSLKGVIRTKNIKHTLNHIVIKQPILQDYLWLDADWDDDDDNPDTGS